MEYTEECTNAAASLSPEILKNLLKTVETLQKQVYNLEVEVTKKNNDIYDLEKEVAELKKRVNAQERYTNKDTLIFRNFDMDSRSNSLSEDFCQLVKNIFS